jgi:HEAT repeat protein
MVSPRQSHRGPSVTKQTSNASWAQGELGDNANQRTNKAPSYLVVQTLLRQLRPLVDELEDGYEETILVPELLKTEPEWDVLASARTMISFSTPARTQRIEILVGRLEELMEKIGPPLIDMLTECEGRYCQLASWALGELGPFAPRQSAEVLAKAFDGTGAGCGPLVIEAIGKLRPSALGVMPVVIKAMSNDIFQIRMEAVETLGQCWDLSKEAVSALLEALLNGKEDIRRQAACWLFSRAKTDDHAKARLTHALKCGNAGTRRIVVGVLESSNHLLEWSGESAVEVIQGLIKALTDNDEFSLEKAARTLAEFGGAARAAVPKLVQLIQEDSQRVQRAAIYALGEIKGPEAWPVLISLLTGDRAWLRTPSASALVKSQAPECIPKLVNLVRHAEAQIRYLSAEVLTAFGADAVPHLIEALTASPESEPNNIAWPDIVVDSGQQIYANIGKGALDIITELRVFWAWGQILEEWKEDIGGRRLELEFEIKETKGIIDKYLPTSARNLPRILKTVQNHFSKTVWPKRPESEKAFNKPKDGRKTLSWTPTAWEAWRIVGRLIRDTDDVPNNGE